ncbi:Oligonucleotide/oligosaccharide-binding (OB)-fold family protein [Candida parapsilosis]|uniref:RNA helicase n=1 Tax=Candida parapsilosis TaxID=5480 RepID=A0A8X7NL16_CANPA|nr:Oligonucleotide/oligosaccharide-binding (OB)-fold family protein [Candida parapsilosis]KAF6046428.1 Oligonucleotide/oligosaccharide-binding (OB)-fold family protein [Candida parapsilosis]KAF6051131.1 Oligonucleotide/oligosaccharide-binding (OB)-fold family protein [Candida parapsilosis]KAF6062146.1 Oligonucleotide/oligosaccharide-binding (OB)-fold family protein [Candida parapsilosis]
MDTPRQNGTGYRRKQAPIEYNDKNTSPVVDSAETQSNLHFKENELHRDHLSPLHESTTQSEIDASQTEGNGNSSSHSKELSSEVVKNFSSQYNHLKDTVDDVKKLSFSSGPSKRDLLQGRNRQHESDKTLKRKNDWETEQFNKAQQLNLQTDDKIHLANNDEYEYVFDESQYVDFDDIEETVIDGDDEQTPAQSRKINGLESEKKSLPVYHYKNEFLNLLKNNQVIIIVGETGSGKTTQLPQYLYEGGYSQRGTKLIGCTQPRRIAAVSVAQRVADEMGTTLGGTKGKIGYSIRFDDNCSPSTVVKFSTDGMLLREFLNDPKLSKYGAIMIDEAHERTLSTEILLSLLKDLSLQRDDLKIVIASATINAAKFSEYFNGAPILNIPGRRFPVEIHYTKHPEANYLQAVMTTIFQIHLTQPLPGDILVFLTGQDDIERLETQIQDAILRIGEQLEDKKLMVCTVYANLPSEYQSRIFEPAPINTRKVILATNIAETSITIEGVSFVVDPGYVKQNEFNSSSGMESLVVVPCSKANCDQRAGRAGRVGPGKCFRMFTKHSFDHDMDASQKPEIQRINLNSVILLLLSLGVNDLLNFQFLDPPPKESIMKSLNLLYSLGAIKSSGKLSKSGFKMNEFPLDPVLTKCILSSESLGVTREICIIIAMLTESSNLKYSPKQVDQEVIRKRHDQFDAPEGDHLTLLNIFTQWMKYGYSKHWCEDNFLQYKTLHRARHIFQQLIRICKKIGLVVNDKLVGDDNFPADNEQNIRENQSSSRFYVSIQKSLLSGFFNNIVKLSPMGDCYQPILRSRQNIPCFVHPSSTLFKIKMHKPKYLVYYELVLTSKEYMRNCLIVDEQLVKKMQGEMSR